MKSIKTNIFCNGVPHWLSLQAAERKKRKPSSPFQDWTPPSLKQPSTGQSLSDSIH